MQTIPILGVEIDVIRSQEILEKVDQFIQSGERAIFAYANVHALNLAYEHPWFRTFLNKADVLYTDGEGVRLGAWLLGCHIPERIVLTTWVWELLGWCVNKGYRVFFIGSPQEIIQRTVENAQKQLANLRVVGAHHGFFDKNGVVSDMVIEKINASSPDVLLVGFGMPLQERWVGENFEKIKAHVIFLTGSCFEYMTGVKSVCPRWISKMGFEWLYRLVQEPRRLFFRYVIGNPLFLFRILKQRLSNDHAL